MQNPKVSIFMPCYNAERFVREAIETTLSQDYPNLVLMISDDASTDGTREILKEYESREPKRIKIFYQEHNLGITKNCNFLLKQCDGDYIAFYASDDIMYPHKISKQIDFLEKNKNFALCGTYTNIIDENSNIIQKIKSYKCKKNHTYNIEDLIESSNSLIPVCSYVARRSCIPPDGFDERLPIASDFLFFVFTSQNGKIKVLDEYLSGYRVHSSHARSMGYFDDSLISYSLLEYYFPQYTKTIIKAKANTYYYLAKDCQNKGLYINWHIYTKQSMVYRVTLRNLFNYIRSSFRLYFEKIIC